MFNNRLYFTVCIALLTIAMLFSLHQCVQNDKIENDYESVLNALSDTLKTERDKHNREVASITVLQAEKKHLEAILSNVRDSVYLRLKEQFTRGAVSAISVDNVTSGVLRGETIILNNTDTVNSFIYATYLFTDSTKWHNFYSIASKDTFFIKYKIKNEFDIWFERQRKNIFSQRYLTVYFRNNNPNTETLELKSFTVSEKPPRKGLMFVLGLAAGVGLKTAFNLSK